jgi:hypothetical protein
VRDFDLTHHSSQNFTIVRGAFGDRHPDFLGIFWLSRRAIAVTAIVFRENLAIEDLTSHGKCLILAHLTGLKFLDDKKSFPKPYRSPQTS